MAKKSPLERKAIILGDEIATGNRPINALCDDSVWYIVKHAKSSKPALDIINEVLACQLLSCWDIPTAPFKLVRISPVSLSKKSYSSRHKPIYYKRLAFGSERLKMIDYSNFLSYHASNDYARLINPDDIFKIGLFDIWVENDDRHKGNANLLFEMVGSDFRVIPIDHAFIFSTMKYNDLKTDPFCENDQNIILSDLASGLKKYKKINSSWKETDRKNFYLYLEKCREKYPQFIKNIPRNWSFTVPLQNAVREFLFNEKRNAKVFEDYLEKMQ